VSLVGGRGGCKEDEFLDNYTKDQDDTLRGLIGDLKQDYPSITKISGHNEYASKACPCFSVEDWLIG
jgi:N-acetylmuramoyl-L-alanine amidase